MVHTENVTWAYESKTPPTFNDTGLTAGDGGHNPTYFSLCDFDSAVVHSMSNIDVSAGTQFPHDMTQDSTPAQQ